MSNKKQETIADIVKEMRSEWAQVYFSEGSRRKDGEYCDNEFAAIEPETVADRIEAAAKREREAGAEAGQICGEIGEMIGRDAARNETVTDCNHFGNAAKMRAALEEISREIWESVDPFCNDDCCKPKRELAKIADAALASPPRNCDVGTAEEQERRWHANCGGDIPNCKRCKVYEQARKSGLVYDKNMIRFVCRFIWGQMPYEEGESEGIVSEIIECDDSVADIVSNMREYADRTEKQGLYDLRECGTEYLRALADLIEAAYKREQIGEKGKKEEQ